jgi:HSP20 family protein
MERNFGGFRRVVELPSAVDTNNIQASFKHGILVITLPKIEDRRGQCIKVEIE